MYSHKRCPHLSHSLYEVHCYIKNIETVKGYVLSTHCHRLCTVCTSHEEISPTNKQNIIYHRGNIYILHITLLDALVTEYMDSLDDTAHNCWPSLYALGILHENIVGKNGHRLPSSKKQSISIRVNNPTLNRNIGKNITFHIYAIDFFSQPQTPKLRTRRTSSAQHYTSAIYNRKYCRAKHLPANLMKPSSLDGENKYVSVFWVCTRTDF